ncbi:MAG: hypothetical protein ABIO88_15225 [Burkholderiaceae bacterium]
MSPNTQLSLDELLVALDPAHLVHPIANLRGHVQRGVTVLQSGRGAHFQGLATARTVAARIRTGQEQPA